MSQFLTRVVLSLCLFALSGCSTSARYSYTGIDQAFVPEPTIRRADPVKSFGIASVPTGCIVELNGEYIGQTPFTLTVEADNNGCWPKSYPDGKPRAFMNRFTCTAPNGATDRRSWRAEDRIPDAVLFRPFGGRYPAASALNLGLTSGS